MPSERRERPRPFSIAWFSLFRTTPAWAIPIAVLNVAGIAYGLWYYVPQLRETPVALWVFAPDSPLAVLWAGLAMLAYWRHRRRGGAEEPRGFAPALLDALAVLGPLQVGLWTVYVLIRYARAFDTFALDRSLVLLVAHAGMVLLSLLFLHPVRERAAREPRTQAVAVAVAVAFYAVQDALDYFGPDYMGRGCGMRPHTVPCEPGLEQALAAVTFALTALGAGVLAWAARGRAGR